MSILSAYLLPHPPLAISAIGKGEEKKIQKTLDAFRQVAQEIAELAPETIIFVTAHNVLYSDYFHISPGKGSKGNFSQFAAPEVKFEVTYDVELAKAIGDAATEVALAAGPMGDKNPRLDHGVMVPLWFINPYYNDYKVVRISPSGMDVDAHYQFGRCVKQAVEQTGRKTVLIASGDLSHKLTAEGPYGYAPEGTMFDNTLMTALTYGDFLALLMMPENLKSAAAACGYEAAVIMAGLFDKQKVDCKVLSYEGPFGVGYGVARLVAGEVEKSRDYLTKIKKITLENARQSRLEEDAYQALARKSLECKIKTGKALEKPVILPKAMTENRAGVFVSLEKNGRLRGCIGTIAATKSDIAAEIMQNAVSAGLMDERFDPVTEAELEELTYCVDVLAAPEQISSVKKLDVKRYGVIVSSGSKRGLLLPNLDGVDTVEEQIAIARRKAGIFENEEISLERFEVVRHGHK
ncbi:MAG: AmmeMemoRadiSam system protein A [Lachnospiraceae bacterium]|nr:AmmeMemoRadiSam system protein A [Lachnospiraceae bacterium]